MTLSGEEARRYQAITDALAQQLVDAHDLEGLAVARGRRPDDPPTADDMEKLGDAYAKADKSTRSSMSLKRSLEEAIDPSHISSDLNEAHRRSLEAQSRATDEILPRPDESTADFEARRQKALDKRAAAREELKQLNVGKGTEPPTTIVGGAGPAEPATAPRPPFPKSIERVFKILHEGGEKNIWEHKTKDGDYRVALPKPGEDPAIIDHELKVLAKLKEKGVKAVEHARVMVGNRAGIIMHPYPLGSKKVARRSEATGQVERCGSSHLLNRNSIRDLEKLLRTLIDEEIMIDDLQFLIDHDGSMFVNDPKNVFDRKAGPSDRNIDMIDLLIQAANENIDRNR